MSVDAALLISYAKAMVLVAGEAMLSGKGTRIRVRERFRFRFSSGQVSFIVRRKQGCWRCCTLFYVYLNQCKDERIYTGSTDPSFVYAETAGSGFNAAIAGASSC